MEAEEKRGSGNEGKGKIADKTKLDGKKSSGRIEVGRTESKEKSFCCEQCGKVAKTKQALERHAAYHNSERPFSCQMCLQRFKNSDDLGKHLRRLRRDGKYEHACRVCHKHFKSDPLLKKHVEMLGCEKKGDTNVVTVDWDASSEENTNTKAKHEDEKVVKCYCKDCDIEFCSTESLKTHYKDAHKDSKRHVCRQCGQTLSTKDSLMRHYSIFHQSDFPFQCEHCSQKFKVKESLCRHVKFVHKDGGYTCEVCERIFSQPVNLKKHMAVHSTTKDFACHVCGKEFRWKQSLQKHLLLHPPATAKIGANKTPVRQEKREGSIAVEIDGVSIEDDSVSMDTDRVAMKTNRVAMKTVVAMETNRVAMKTNTVAMKTGSSQKIDLSAKRDNLESVDSMNKNVNELKEHIDEEIEQLVNSFDEDSVNNSNDRLNNQEDSDISQAFANSTRDGPTMKRFLEHDVEFRKKRKRNTDYLSEVEEGSLGYDKLQGAVSEFRSAPQPIGSGEDLNSDSDSEFGNDFNADTGLKKMDVLLEEFHDDDNEPPDIVIDLTTVSNHSDHSVSLQNSVQSDSSQCERSSSSLLAVYSKQQVNNHGPGTSHQQVNPSQHIPDQQYISIQQHINSQQCISNHQHNVGQPYIISQQHSGQQNIVSKHDDINWSHVQPQDIDQAHFTNQVDDIGHQQDTNQQHSEYQNDNGQHHHDSQHYENTQSDCNSQQYNYTLQCQNSQQFDDSQQNNSEENSRSQQCDSLTTCDPFSSVSVVSSAGFRHSETWPIFKPASCLPTASFRPSPIFSVFAPSGGSNQEKKFKAADGSLSDLRQDKNIEVSHSIEEKQRMSTSKSEDNVSKTSKEMITVVEKASSSRPKPAMSPGIGKFSLIKHMLSLQNEEHFDKAVFDNPFKVKPSNMKRLRRIAEMHKVNDSDKYSVTVKQNIPFQWLGLSVRKDKDIAKSGKSVEKEQSSNSSTTVSVETNENKHKGISGHSDNRTQRTAENEIDAFSRSENVIGETDMAADADKVAQKSDSGGPMYVAYPINITRDFPNYQANCSASTQDNEALNLSTEFTKHHSTSTFHTLNESVPITIPANSRLNTSFQSIPVSNAFSEKHALALSQPGNTARFCGFQAMKSLVQYSHANRDRDLTNSGFSALQNPFATNSVPGPTNIPSSVSEKTNSIDAHSKYEMAQLYNSNKTLLKKDTPFYLSSSSTSSSSLSSSSSSLSSSLSVSSMSTLELSASTSKSPTYSLGSMCSMASSQPADFKTNASRSNQSEAFPLKMSSISSQSKALPQVMSPFNSQSEALPQMMSSVSSQSKSLPQMMSSASSQSAHFQPAMLSVQSTAVNNESSMSALRFTALVSIASSLHQSNVTQSLSTCTMNNSSVSNIGVTFSSAPLLTNSSGLEDKQSLEPAPVKQELVPNSVYQTNRARMETVTETTQGSRSGSEVMGQAELGRKAASTGDLSGMSVLDMLLSPESNCSRFQKIDHLLDTCIQ